MGKKVLVVDDDPLYLDLVRDIFAVKDIEVQAARKGAEALALLKSCTPAFIMSDFDMPDMNGMEFHAHLQKDERTKRIPFAFLTGSADAILSRYVRDNNLQLFNKLDVVNELLRLSETLK